MLSCDRRLLRALQTMENGQRQILSLYIPGDIPDLQSLYLHRMDHDLITLALLPRWASSATHRYAA